jgi:hypothetical protein
VLGLSLARYGDYEERIETLVDYERFLMAFREGVLGLADRARDIPSINKIIYHNDNAKLAAYIFESPYMPAHLVIAWMMAEDKANIEHLIVQYDVIADKEWSIKGDKIPPVHEKNMIFHKNWNALKDYIRNNQPPQSAFEKEASL